MRIRLPCNRVRAFPFRRAASRKPGNGEIEAAPEEMYRAYLSDKLASEFFESRIGLQKNSMEPVHVLGIVGGMLIIIGKRNRIRDLDRFRPYLYVNCHRMQCSHEFTVEVRDRARV